MDLTAEASTRGCVDTLVRTRGILNDIISFRDSRFMSDFWGSLMAQLGIKCSQSTAYHPQADCQAENVNAVVNCYLNAYVARHPMELDSLLPLAGFT